MTTRAIYVLFMLLIFFMLKDQDLSFEICCENTMTGKRNATGQVYSSMVLSYMWTLIYKYLQLWGYTLGQ